MSFAADIDQMIRHHQNEIDQVKKNFEMYRQKPSGPDYVGMTAKHQTAIFKLEALKVAYGLRSKELLD
jgi:hypothetical protein